MEIFLISFSPLAATALAVLGWEWYKRRVIYKAAWKDSGMLVDCMCKEFGDGMTKEEFLSNFKPSENETAKLYDKYLIRCLEKRGVKWNGKK